MKKALTFVAAQLLALGTLSALAVLIVTSISLYEIREHVGAHGHNAAVVYSEVPLAFLCACFAQMVYRIRPVFVATVFVLLKTCVRIYCISYVAISRHFWGETILSYGAALIGAAAVARVFAGEERQEPMHPALAFPLALAATIITWGITWLVAAVRQGM